MPNPTRQIVLDDLPRRFRMNRNQQAMALPKCAKCGRETSDSALVCPACGAPTSTNPSASAAQPKNRRSPVPIIAVIAVCLFVVAFFVAPYLSRLETTGAPETMEVPDVDAVKARAEKGEAAAQTTLGSLFSKGLGVPQDYGTAAQWYRLAADQEYAEAQLALGQLYEVGQGVPRDEAEAARWFQLAAEQGHAAAQYSLAILYVTGKGVTADLVTAVKWYRQAAEQGDALAQFNLGVRYYEGNGVKPDPIEAYQWLSLAGDQDIPDAIRILNQLKPRMTGEQIAEGKRRVKAFVARPAAPVSK